MFEADWTWVGVVVGAAAVAVRTYRRGSKMTEPSVSEEAIRVLRNYLWGNRDAVLDSILLHECDMREGAFLLLRLADLDADRWLSGATLDDRHVAESHHG